MTLKWQREEFQAGCSFPFPQTQRADPAAAWERRRWSSKPSTNRTTEAAGLLLLFIAEKWGIGGFWALAGLGNHGLVWVGRSLEDLSLSQVVPSPLQPGLGHSRLHYGYPIMEEQTNSGISLFIRPQSQKYWHYWIEEEKQSHWRKESPVEEKNEEIIKAAKAERVLSGF